MAGFKSSFSPLWSCDGDNLTSSFHICERGRITALPHAADGRTSVLAGTPHQSLESVTVAIIYVRTHMCTYIGITLCPARRGDKENTHHQSAVTTSVETGAGRGRTLTISFVSFCIVLILYDKNVLLCYCVIRKYRPRRTKDMTRGFEFSPQPVLEI